jgi:hypothetical protein
MNLRKMQKFWFCGLVMVFLAACSTINPPLPPISPDEHTQEPVTQTSMTAVPSIVLTIPNDTMPAPSPTFTQTPTRTNIPTITWTPQPTLEPAAAFQAVQDLIATNQGCRLPCWWGLIPGETHWGVAEHFLAPFTQILHFKTEKKYEGGASHTYDTYEVTYPVEGVPRGGGASITTKDDVIDYIFVGSGSTRPLFSVDQLLREYQMPTQVYIITYANAPFLPLPFALVIYYEEQNILAVYELDGNIQGKSLVGCPQNIAPEIHLWSDEITVTEKSINNWALGQLPNRLLSPLEYVTAISLEEFTDIFSAADNETCIETPAELW